MSSIRIVSTPPGQAPDEVRKSWVGLVIPLPEQDNGGLQMGVRGGKPKQLGGYQVYTTEALDILRKKSPEAAEWFEENAFLSLRFVFAKEVCELIP